MTVGFSLAFVSHPDMPRAAFFTCQQHAPEHFWKREYQTHANGAETIIEVALVAREPELYADFLESLAGATASFVGTDSVAVPTGRGRVMCVSPKSFEARYGSVPPALDHGPRVRGVCDRCAGAWRRRCPWNSRAFHESRRME